MDTVQARRWTRHEYDRMIEAGILTPNDRVELVDGEILAMTPQGSAHATAVVLLQEALRAAVGPDFHLRVQLPLALGAESEPEPDLALVAGSPRDYRDAHPKAAPLVVEVADATLAYDRDVKGSLYARAGIQEFWLVNLTDKVIEVYRAPSVKPLARFGWHYTSVERLGPRDFVAPQSRPHARIAVADLLP